MSKFKLLPSHSGHIAARLVGSEYIFGEGNDTDILWLTENAVSGRQYLIESGYDCESDTRPEYDDAKFYSLRQGRVNILVCADKEYYEKFLLAAEVCKGLQLKDRDDRVLVHKIVRDGHTV